mmetsp:Transcript_10912/g.21362  ORF Transcript_10912/g.21362 Transcript_10912/m.21362 type:complete len:288 (-) Transcript_10912:130-993(-)
MDLGDLESSLKVLVLGASNVGKTSLATMYSRNEFPMQYKKTIGAEFKEKNIYLEEACEDVNLMIWEIGGEHVDAQMSVKYFKGASAAVIVFAVDNRDSFDRVPELIAKVRKESGPMTRIVVVQNKIDVSKEETVVSDLEARDMARDMHARLYRVTCKDAELVDEIFLYVASKCVGAAATLVDISDIDPSINDDSSFERVREELGHSSQASEHTKFDSVPVKEKENEEAGEPVALNSNQNESTQSLNGPNLVSPAASNHAVTSSAPTKSLVPSKQRTKGKKKKACIIS